MARGVSRRSLGFVLIGRGELLAGKERIYFDLLDRNESGAALMHEQRGSAGSIEAVIHDLSLL